MSSSGYPYRETLLQWIWQELEFDTTSLRTTDGEPVEIIQPGTINRGAGPDFSGAELRIGALKIYGDVEIHIHPGHWAQHRHRESEDFNSVILHVVYDGDASRTQPVQRPDGTTPPLLKLKPYLQKPLTHLLERKQQAGLPCSGQIRFINQAAFEAQIDKAHRHYFEYKTDFLLNYYNSNLPLTKAWLGLLTRGFFHTLGIPRNRAQMEHLHDNMPEYDPQLTADMFIERVASVAFQNSSERAISWAESGMRPASLPAKRVPQAAALFHAVYSTPFKTFLTAGDDMWPNIIQRIPEVYRPGGQMSSILQHTVFYPAVYLLGEFLHAQKVKKHAYERWLNARGGVPGEVSRPFKSSGFIINSKTRKYGLAHQLKRYCRPMNCHRCEVFKKAINP